MFCPECGHEMPGRPQYCRSCGRRIEYSSQDSCRGGLGLTDPRDLQAIPGNRIDGYHRPQMTKRTAKPVIGGVLVLISAVVGLMIGLLAVNASTQTDRWSPDSWTLFGLGIGCLVLGVIAAVGMSYAFARRAYCWAVVGAVSALIILVPVGALALTLIVTSHEEFERNSNGPSCPGCGKASLERYVICLNCGHQLPGLDDGR